MKNLMVIIPVLFLLAACAPEVGSDAWCADMKEKPTSEWTGKSAADFTKHCVFK